jgi:hypothetical protein
VSRAQVDIQTELAEGSKTTISLDGSLVDHSQWLSAAGKIMSEQPKSTAVLVLGEAFIQATGDGEVELWSGDGSDSPPHSPPTIGPCPDCNGTGGPDPEAVARARRFTEAYRKALMGEENGT